MVQELGEQEAIFLSDSDKNRFFNTIWSAGAGGITGGITGGSWGYLLNKPSWIRKVLLSGGAGILTGIMGGYYLPLLSERLKKSKKHALLSKIKKGI